MGSTDTSSAPGGPALTSPLKVVAVLLALTGLVTILYWVAYFTTGAVQSESSTVYIAFENSFPAADAWMSLCCFLGAAGLFSRREAGRQRGLLFGLAAGSAMIFLGLMDVLYNLEQGMYLKMSTEMGLEVLINVWTLGFGAFLLVFLWSRRKTLLG